MSETSRFNLSYESIDSICNRVEEHLVESRANRRETIRIKLMVEETLLQYRDAYPEDTRVEVDFSKSILKSRISLQIFCEAFNPFTEDEGLMKSLVGTSAESGHSWKYVQGLYSRFIGGESRNVIDFTINLDKKINNPIVILASLAIGALLALILRAILPADLLLTVCNDYIMPLGNAYTGLLCVMAILLIFFSIPLCMVQYGNGKAFQKDVNSLLKKFVLITTILVLITLLAAVVFFGITAESETFSTIFKPIFDVFIDFIPSNLVNPFLNFNCMQVLIIGVLFGIAFLIMGDSAKGLVKAFDKVNLVAVIANGLLAKLVCIYSGLMIFYFVATNTGTPRHILWIIGVTIIIGILAYFIAAIIVSVRLNVRLNIVLKKFLPSFLINLSSASVGASFIVFFDELAKDSGVDVNYTAVSVNIGTVLFKPMYSVFFAAVSFLIAAASGGISLSTSIQIVVLSVVLPMAIPNIPGGASPIIIILLSSLGFGNAYNDSIISINSILQFFIVPLNVFLLQCLVVIQANLDNKIDIDKMRETQASKAGS